MAIKTLPPDDLGDLRPTLYRVLMRLLVGPLGKELGSHLARNAVRLTDQAVAEYRAAYRDLRRFVDDDRLDGFIGGQSRFENTIISLHRARGYFEALRRLGMTLSDGSMLIPRPKECEFLRDSVGSQLTDLRDAIVHLDERLRKTPHQVGEPIALDLRTSGLYLEGHSLSWSALTRSLRQANQLASRFGLTSASTTPRPARRSYR